MALKIPLPTTKEIYLKLDTSEDKRGKLEVTDDPEQAGCKVGFRQGTNEDDAARNGLLAKRKYSVEDGTFQEIVETSVDDVIKLDVKMTLVDTDIEMPNGKSLEFEERNGLRRVKSDQFDQWWGALPSGWVVGIYRACIEVNPDWFSKRS